MDLIRLTPTTHPPATPGGRAHERGQVIVIFAGGIVLFTLLLAVVLDVSWYWANTLRVQRAADAAALAGAVYLPGDRTTAYSSARSEARKNGYADGANSVVTPAQDGVNPRQLNVTVSADVGTFFMRVIGIRTIRATRASKAEYVLPVPMGSPQNYYGVGFYQGVVPASTSTTTGSTSWLRPAAAPNGGWTNPQYAYVADETPPAVRYATRATVPSNNAQTMQAYGSFAVSIPSGASVTGIEVRMQAYSSDTTGCRIGVALNSGAVAVNDGSWTTAVHQADLGGSPPETTTPATLGGAADTVGSELDPGAGREPGLPRPGAGPGPRTPEQLHQLLDRLPRPGGSQGPLLDDGHDTGDVPRPGGPGPGRRKPRHPGLLGRGLHLRRHPRERRSLRAPLHRRQQPARRDERRSEPRLRPRRLQLHGRGGGRRPGPPLRPDLLRHRQEPRAEAGSGPATTGRTTEPAAARPSVRSRSASGCSTRTGRRTPGPTTPRSAATWPTTRGRGRLATSRVRSAGPRARPRTAAMRTARTVPRTPPTTSGSCRAAGTASRPAPIA